MSLKNGVLLLFLYGLSACEHPEKKDKADDLKNGFAVVESQPVEKRVISEERLRRISEINISKRFQLYQPYLLHLLKDRIILFDASPEQLNFVVFDTTWSLTNRFGRFGRGPGEYLNILDLAIDRKNELIFAVDDRNAKVETWSFDGELIRTQEMNRNVYRLISFKDSFIIHDSKQPTNFIYEQDLQFSERKSIVKAETAIDHPVERFFVLSGSVVADTTLNTVFYAGWGNSTIKSYTLDGEEKFSYSTIEPIEFYFPSQNDNGGFARDISKRPATRDLELYGDYLVTLYTGKTEYADQILDFYDKKTGIYEYSVKLDHKTTGISSITDGGIFYALSKYNGDWLIVRYQLQI